MTELPGGYSAIALTAPDEFDWQIVEAAAGVSFDNFQHGRLADAVTRYLVDLAFEHAAPYSVDVRMRLEVISRHSKGLAEVLSMQDQASEEAVNSVWPWSRTIDPGIVKALLWELSTLAKQRQLIAGRVGRRRHAALSGFALEVRAIWHDAGGAGNGCYWNAAKGLYAGRLLDLIHSLITQVPDAEPPKARTICKIVTT